MDTEYDLVKYSSEHAPLVAGLQRGLWSTDTCLNQRYLEWKYPADPLIYLALHQNEPVAMRGFHEARLEVGMPRRVFPVLIAGDAFVAPSHRNRGLVTRIMKLAYSDLVDRGYPFLLSLGGANRLNVFGLLTLGWRSAGMLRPLGRVTRRANLTRNLSRTITKLPMLWRFSESRVIHSADQRDPFRHLDRARFRRSTDQELPITVQHQARPEFMAKLVEHLGHDGRIRYVRDAEYLTWRFANPLTEYRFLFWERGPGKGYLVLSRRNSDLGGWDRVYISDLEATDKRIRAALLSAAIRWGRFPELVTWTASFSDEELRLFKSHNFLPVDPQDTTRGCPCILVRPLDESLLGTDWMLGYRHILDTGNWDVRVLFSMRG